MSRGSEVGVATSALAAFAIGRSVGDAERGDMTMRGVPDVTRRVTRLCGLDLATEGISSDGWALTVRQLSMAGHDARSAGLGTRSTRPDNTKSRYRIGRHENRDEPGGSDRNGAGAKPKGAGVEPSARALATGWPVVLLLAASITALEAAPPGEATNLRWCAGSKDCLEWDAAVPPGDYGVHRGTRASLPALADGSIDSCLAGTFASTSTGAWIAEVPVPGEVFWFLVVARSCLEAGPAGTGDWGPRVVDADGDCALASCADGVRNGAETGVDCGGACGACPAGETCCAGTDCASLICTISADLGSCAAATCGDGIRNGTETDVDCGGGACPGCATNQLCNGGSDCQSGVCGGNGRCAAPTCIDGVRNGAETGVDCGGPACVLCGLGETCLAGSDCASGVCPGGTCEPGPACTPASMTNDRPAAGDRFLTTCGASGNTYWSYTPATTTTHAALDLNDTIYLTSGSVITVRTPATAANIGSATISGVTLGRPLVFEGRNAIGAPSHLTRLFFAGSNGYLYGLHPVTLLIEAAVSLRRTTSDSISAPIVAQLWEQSDANFRSAQASDLVIAGTHYSGTTTANRVYGLNGSTGAVVWFFNPTGSFQMDAVNGLTVDTSRNLVYAVSEHTNPSGQNTVWAIRTLNGTKLWSRDLGAIEAEPALGNGGLYVAAGSGTLYKLDPATGATIWQLEVTTTATITRLVADPSMGRVYVVDSDGNLEAIDDGCTSGTPAWSFKPVAANVTAPPAILGSLLYVGADDGRSWQVRASDGVGQAWATVSASGSAFSNDSLVFSEGPDSRLLASSGGLVKKLCIPWPDTPGDKAWLPLLSLPDTILAIRSSRGRWRIP